MGEIMRSATLVLLALAACAGDDGLNQLPGDAGLTLEEPASASWHTNLKINARGRAPELSNVRFQNDAVTMNGDDWTAQTTVEPGLTLVEVRGEDSTGHELFLRHSIIAGTFGDVENKIQNGAYIRLNEPGFTAMEPILDELLTEETVAGILAGVNPLLDINIPVIGQVNATLDSLSWDDFEFDIDAHDGYGEIDVEITGFSGAASASAGSVGGSVTLSSDVELYSKILVEARGGRPVITLTETEITLTDTELTSNTLPSAISIIATYLIDAFKETIEGIVEDQLVPLIEDQIGSIVGGLDLSFGTELLGKSLNVSASFAELGFDNDGLFGWLDIDVQVPQDTSFPYLGYLETEVTADPVIPSFTQVGASMSDNLLNRILFEVWAGGMIDLTLSTEDDSLPAIALVPLKATEGTIKVSAELPPVATKRNGDLALEFGNIKVELNTPDGELGQNVTLMLDGYAPVEPLLEGGELKLEIGTPNLSITVIDSDWGVPREEMTNLFSEMLPIDLLLAMFADLSFPMPALGPIQITDGTVVRDGNGTHTNVRLNFE